MAIYLVQTYKGDARTTMSVVRAEDAKEALETAQGHEDLKDLTSGTPGIIWVPEKLSDEDGVIFHDWEVGGEYV